MPRRLTRSVYTLAISAACFAASQVPAAAGPLRAIADYDGDGKTDLAIYLTTSGTWSILLSGSGYTPTLSKNWRGAGVHRGAGVAVKAPGASITR